MNTGVIDHCLQILGVCYKQRHTMRKFEKRHWKTSTDENSRNGIRNSDKLKNTAAPHSGEFFSL